MPTVTIACSYKKMDCQTGDVSGNQTLYSYKLEVDDAGNIAPDSLRTNVDKYIRDVDAEAAQGRFCLAQGCSGSGSIDSQAVMTSFNAAVQARRASTASAGAGYARARPTGA